MARRDPLSVRYDGYVHDLMLAAARASRNNAAVQAQIVSPAGELYRVDRGGRTAHERAFTRSCYWLIWKNGGNPGRSGWSLRLEWGPLASAGGGKVARVVQARLFLRGVVQRGAQRWVGTSLQSTAGNRIDSP